MAYDKDNYKKTVRRSLAQIFPNLDQMERYGIDPQPIPEMPQGVRSSLAELFPNLSQMEQYGIDPQSSLAMSPEVQRSLAQIFPNLGGGDNSAKVPVGYNSPSFYPDYFNNFSPEVQGSLSKLFSDPQQGEKVKAFLQAAQPQQQGSSNSEQVKEVIGYEHPTFGEAAKRQSKIDPTSAFLDYWSLQKPEPDKDKQDRLRRLARNSSITEALRLMIEGFYGTKGAVNRKRDPNPYILKAYQDMDVLRKEYRQDLQRWKEFQLNNLIRKLAYDTKERQRAEDKAFDLGKIDKWGEIYGNRAEKSLENAKAIAEFKHDLDEGDRSKDLADRKEIISAQGEESRKTAAYRAGLTAQEKAYEDARTFLRDRGLKKDVPISKGIFNKVLDLIRTDKIRSIDQQSLQVGRHKGLTESQYQEIFHRNVQNYLKIRNGNLIWVDQPKKLYPNTIKLLNHPDGPGATLSGNKRDLLARRLVNYLWDDEAGFEVKVSLIKQELIDRAHFNEGQANMILYNILREHNDYLKKLDKK